MKPTLLVLAAGMGSRYGGLKQLDPMGPNGETILDYSIRDAHTAGFEKVVFVIREDFEQEFRTVIGGKFSDCLEVCYAFQKLDDLPKGFTPSKNRTKPWGTSHAIRAARTQISDPFAVINADDFYGADGYLRAIKYLRTMNHKKLDSAMVGYPIKNTLSPHGSVNRGICKLVGTYLESVEEVTEIRQLEDGRITGNNCSGEAISISGNALVSMNLWCFPPSFIEAMEAHFIQFLRENGTAERSECYLPTVVDELIHLKKMDCTVLPTTGKWFGVTYPEDREMVCRQLAALK